MMYLFHNVKIVIILANPAKHLLISVLPVQILIEIPQILYVLVKTNFSKKV